MNHLWGVIDPDGLDLLRVQMYFLRVSEDVRQQNPYAGLLVLDKQKYEVDRILSWAHPIRNLSTTISGLKHVLRDVRPELNLRFQGSKPLMGCNWSRWIRPVARPNLLPLGLWRRASTKTLCRITRLRYAKISRWQNTLQGPPKQKFIDNDLRLKAYCKRREARTQP